MVVMEINLDSMSVDLHQLGRDDSMEKIPESERVV